MFDVFVNQEGGLTTKGYVLAICTIVIFYFLAVFFARKKNQDKKLTAKQLTICAMCIALGFVTSYITLIKMPFGGTITLCSMLFIVLAGYFYGIKTGLCVGFVYGILQFIQDPYVLSFFQVCCDYLLAFMALGLAGVFVKKKNGLIKGYIVAIVARGLFHTLGGYLYWMDYMPDNFPESIAFSYPLVYNFSYILGEAIITLIIISLPPVKAALQQIKKMVSE